ncbi:MAG: flagellar hook assembly protein FlgD [Desulfobulbus sp.]|nr:MAG: flagellar hook assembly protein FlgD [Desulfobulbus sp.]
MTYIPGISQGYTAADQAAKAAAKTGTDSGDKKADNKRQTLGQDDFLTLLVAQLQNQDPLNPSDPTEFTAQLANYSQLEQLFNLNDSMDKLAQSQNNSDRLSALSMIGKEVLVEGSSFQLGEGTTEIGYKVDGAASEIQIHIQDSAGQRVATLNATELTTGTHSITWQGVDENGEHLPAGKYSIVIESKSSAEGETVGVSPLVRADVTGVDLGDGGAVLITDVGEFSMTDIQGVYEANSSENDLKNDGRTTDTENSEENLSSATDGAGIVGEAVSTVQAVQDAADTVNGG